jgi:hypothetical protein
LVAGGVTSSVTNAIEYVTIATTGNAISFGQLTLARYNVAGCSSGTRGVFAGGASPITNVMDYVTIATTGNAVDFGDLLAAVEGIAASSSGHGGL